MGSVDRRAGRGLDGNTHAPLISLADRLSSSHSGHQIQGASIDPFHAAPQSRTRSRRRLNRRGLKVAIEGLAVAQDAPGDARELVGQGNGKFVLVQSARCSCEPSAEAIPGPIMRAHQENLRRLDQQRAQVLAAPLGDATQDGSPARAVLSRHEAEPGAKVAPPFKSLAGVDCSYNAGRDQRPDTRHTHQPPAHGLAMAEFFDLACDSLDALVQMAPVIVKAEDQPGRSRRYLVLSVLQYREERVAKGTRTSPDGDALLDEKGSDLVDRRCSAGD